MTTAGSRSVRGIAVAGACGLAVVAALLSGCAGQGSTGPGSGASGPAGTATVRPAGASVPRAGPAASPAPAARPPGTIGTFWVGSRWITFTEPAHAGVTGARLGPRTLLTQVFYPLGRGRSGPAAGPLPMLVFAPGFMQCGAPYSRLLRGWASAGYVVAVVNFPRSDCKVGTAATESDMVNQPGDMSYVITRLLRLSAARAGFFAGLINPRQIAVTGQSDGGDTVAAIAANGCCSDRRVRAVAVLSGAEWPPMPGRYFAGRPVPMLFTQGSADTVNPPGCSVVMYQADPSPARFYLDLFGASHTGPYWGRNRYSTIVLAVTTAFFDRYLLGRRAAAAAMRRDGTVPGLAALDSSGRDAPPSRYCNT